MSQINALKVCKNLKSRMVEFALDDNYVRDEKVRSALKTIFNSSPETGGLSTDLWVEGAFPSKTAEETIEKLVEKGEFDAALAKTLDATGSFPLNRAPYLHQTQSIKAAQNGYAQKSKPAIVISAGTGAGKTESFLLPMLEDIYNSPAIPGEGVSAIILYPMNALVNDQVTRLQEWLREQDRATFIHFTSETPETVRLANKQGIADAGSFRYRSRQHARGLEDRKGRATTERGDIPRILITNYSMLEYMLCRPQDFVFFGRNLRSLVLDEAHLYTGNLAAEISLLLKRVYAKCRISTDDVLQYATSATIGGEDDPEAVLSNFAGQLFSKPATKVKVIIGERVDSPFPPELSQMRLSVSDAEKMESPAWPENLQTLTVDSEGETKLATLTTENWQQLTLAVSPFLNGDTSIWDEHNTERQPAPALAKALINCPALALASKALQAQPRLPLKKLAQEIFSDETEVCVEATRRCLSLGAMARQTPFAYPLLPNRIHYLIRGADGIHVSFSPRNAPNKALQINDKCYLRSASTQLNDSDETIPLSLARCKVSGEWFIAGQDNGGRLSALSLPILLGYEKPNDNGVRYFSLNSTTNSRCFYFHHQTGELRGKNDDSIRLYEVTECPATGDPINDSVQFFAEQSRLQLGLLAEAALMEMPPYPDASKQWKPAEGRRLLLFSDSRTEAARLGPRFTGQHELQLIRAAISEELSSKTDADPEVINYYQKKIEEAKVQLSTLPETSPLRAPLLTDKARAEAFVSQLNNGQKITEWLTDIERNERMSQFIDLRSAGSHNANDPSDKEKYWNQAQWERNRDRAKERLLLLIAGEFAIKYPWPYPSLENEGLAEVIYYGVNEWPCPTSLRSQLSPAIEVTIRTIWPDFICSILDEVRNQGAITLGSQLDDSSFEFGSNRLGKYMSWSSRATRVSPIKSIGKVRDFVRVVLTRAGTREAIIDPMVDAVLEAAFSQLCDYASNDSITWLKIDERQVDTGASVNCIQLQLKELGLRKPQNLYRCKNTGRIICRSVLGAYIGCINSDLEPVTSDTLDTDPRMGRRRREFKDSLIFQMGLWGEEHSAQLAPQENLRIQNLFKAGVRNILSSTTTLELGIDIGGLNGVLMGNIPPGKANYLQRAGRAGRRADGSSLVLGFARSTPYEREVFLDFGKYLNAPLRKPTIFLNRSEIVWRHIHAHLLGHFFGVMQGPSTASGAMNAFGRMGSFCGVSEIPYWVKDNSKPDIRRSEDLRSDSRFSIGECAIADHFLVFLEQTEKSPGELRDRLLELSSANMTVFDALKNSWNESLSNIRKIFMDTVNDWKEEYDRLLKNWKEIEAINPLARAAGAAIYHQAKTFFNLTVIESLGDKLVIPRYGFPIGLSQLRVAEDPSQKLDNNELPVENRYRLQRDAGLALREYVPGSKLIAGGRLITSHGLLKHWTGEDINTPDSSLGLRAYYTRAQEAGQFLYSYSGIPEITSESGTGTRESGELLFTKHGFTTASWDPPTISFDYKTVGRVHAYSSAFNCIKQTHDIFKDYAGLTNLEARYQHAGELVLMNSGEFSHGFAVCTKCGYAESERKATGEGRLQLRRSFLWHEPIYSNRKGIFHCWDSDEEAPVLRHQHLAAKQVTHLVLFDLSQWLNVSILEHRHIANTVAQCLRLFGCTARDLDTREVSVLQPLASPSTRGGCAIVLYDAVSGGSGHVYEMLKALQRSWWKGAADLLKSSNDNDDARARAMLRRIVTADSPTANGVPEYDPLNAEKLLKAILEGSEPEFNLPQQLFSHENNSDENREPSGPVPNLANIERLKDRRPPKALMEIPPFPQESTVHLAQPPRGMKSNMQPVFLRFSSSDGISMKSNYLVQLQTGEYAFGRIIQMGGKHRFKPAETKHKIPSEEITIDQIIAIHTPSLA